MQETKVSPYLKQLQKNALLFLQLAALLLLVFALIKPFIPSTTVAGSQVILIVDTSATMLAGKEQPIFEEHIRQMKKLTEELHNKPVTLITSGNSPEVLLRQESDKSVILQTLDSLSVTYEEEQLPKAINVAQALIGNEATSIYVFTDSIERNMLPVENNLVEWHVIGAENAKDNISITKLAATSNEQNITALVQLQNDTEENVTFNLKLTNDKKEQLAQEEVTIEPHEQVSKLYDQIPTTSTIYASIDVEDDYKVDNEALTLLQPNTMEVLIDPTMHRLVQKGFIAVYDEVTYFDEASTKNATENAFFVSNDVELMNKIKTPMFLIGRNDKEPKEINAMADNTKHPLFSFSPLEDVYISKLYPQFDDYETIATVNEEPFIQLSPSGDIILLTDLEGTDWPLHPSFPLFLWSTIQELTTSGQALGTFTPLEERAIPLVEGDWSIYRADGEYVSSFENGKRFRAPAEPGLYRVVAEGEEKQFTVGLSQGERLIKEGASFTIGQLQEKSKKEQQKISIVPYLIILILTIIVIEWEVQRRRGFTN